MNFLPFLFRQKSDKKPPCSVAILAENTIVPQLATAPRWNSDLDDAQLKFLSGFLRGAECPADDGSRWMDVLNVAPSIALAIMVEVGLLAPAPLALKVERLFKATEVKAMLRERGLAVSGRKGDCIASLITADQAGMEAKLFRMAVFVCTERGRIPAEAYLSREAERQRRARQSSSKLLSLALCWRSASRLK